MSKKNRHAILFGVFGMAVILAATMLYMVLNRGYHAYAGEWEMEKGYIYNEDNHQYEEILLDGTRHIRNKDTKKYEIIKTKKGTIKIDNKGNFVEMDAFGEQDKGKLKIYDGKVSYTGKCQSGNYRWDFEKSGNRMVLYESVDPSSADENMIVLATKTKYIYVRR